MTLQDLSTLEMLFRSLEKNSHAILHLFLLQVTLHVICSKIVVIQITIE